MADAALSPKEEIDMLKIRAEIQKLFDDAAKSRAEAEKIRKETRFYPYFGFLAAGAALFGAAAAFAKIFL
ncbi:MAG: hypothetical protein LBG78_08565 [Azoarcus sp.]|jgi:hypothetical protein|nr:hypothetical protein [Azoarcus sp.]